MNANELLVLKAYQIREINVTSVLQTVNFKLSDESEIEITMTDDRRLLVRSKKLGQPLNVKPIAANTLEIFPELPENYFHVEQPPEITLPSRLPRKPSKTPLKDDETPPTPNNAPTNEKADLWGVTASKMTMKKKKGK